LKQTLKLLDRNIGIQWQSAVVSSTDYWPCLTGGHSGRANRIRRTR